MVHPSRSILPKWYAEVKFLESEAIGATSDTTHSFVFGRLYKTPSNRTYRDGNHLRINFCHLEFPYDCNGCLAEPPDNIAQTVSAIYGSSYQNNQESLEETAGAVLARCVVDYTVQTDSQLVASIVSQFGSAGYKCEQGLEDAVMRIVVTDKTTACCKRPEAVVIGRVGDCKALDALVDCNARAFGYDVSGDTEWLHAKLARQINQSKQFSVYTATDDAKVLAFAVIYRSVEKAPDLAFVQVIGTAPEHRRRGLATAVIRHALRQLPVDTHVYLEAFDHQAIALYKDIGFEKAGTVYSTECTLRK
ncbi:hypothetical protein EV175_000013 [Coemansia sp. RSA 1933]|nr:hypothetical protein EV175_000013 [Coemansia sp. RSA 1933]